MSGMPSLKICCLQPISISPNIVAHLEPSRISTLQWSFYLLPKSSTQIIDWVLNTPLSIALGLDRLHPSKFWTKK